jgi:hypothetical protein
LLEPVRGRLETILMVPLRLLTAGLGTADAPGEAAGDAAGEPLGAADAAGLGAVLDPVVGAAGAVVGLAAAVGLAGAGDPQAASRTTAATDSEDKRESGTRRIVTVPP